MLDYLAIKDLHMNERMSFINAMSWPIKVRLLETDDKQCIGGMFVGDSKCL